MPEISQPQLAEGQLTQTQGLFLHHKASFEGFAPPTSNTTYTPNQFFDVCLPHYSRGVVRLVAYMIRKTLGWCDADGNPQEDQILVSYQDLVEHAGISRDMIRRALDEAIEGRFIQCVRQGRPKSAHSPAITGLYELCWDDTGEYVKDPNAFRGFFDGEGHRTDIPNQFFDHVIPNEPLSVVKVVGSVIRFSIGFQARRGRRRQQVQLSYNQILRYANIRNRTTLSEAIQQAVDNNYIVRLREGVFSPIIDDQTSTMYGLRWLDMAFYLPIGQKNVPDPEEGIGQKNVPGHESEKRTRVGQKNVPGNRSEKRTTIEMKHRNETSKQQQLAQREPPAVAAHNPLVSLLQEQGFSQRDAFLLATTYPEEQIRNQINWLGKRNAVRNPLGMLRRAIEENWEEPQVSKEQGGGSSAALGSIFAACFYAGVAGNEEDPTAEPSSNDAETAERYVMRLLEVWPEKDLVPQWGREFGRMAAEETHSKKMAVVSCVVALRWYGDEFYGRLRTRRHEVVREAVKSAQKSHIQRYWSQYLDYLRREEQRIKNEHSETYSEFENSLAGERKQIEENRFFSEEARQAQLQRFDSEGQHLRAFRQFFDDLLDFWKWDKEYNLEPFDKSKVTL